MTTPSNREQEIFAQAVESDSSSGRHLHRGPIVARPPLTITIPADDLKRAISILVRLRQLSPQSVSVRLRLRDAHWTRALTFGALARHEEAAAGWRKALELDSGRSWPGPLVRGRDASLA